MLKTQFARISILIMCTFSVGASQMFPDFLGEPATIGDMRIDDKYWVPAHCLEVDNYANCWLDPKQSLNQDSDHLILVNRFKANIVIKYTFKTKNIVRYAVTIDKAKLQGWRWKITKNTKKYYLDKKFILVHSLFKIND